MEGIHKISIKDNYLLIHKLNGNKSNYIFAEYKYILITVIVKFMVFSKEIIQIEAGQVEVYDLLVRNIENSEISFIRNKKELDKSEQSFVGKVNNSEFKMARNKKNSFFHPPALVIGSFIEKENTTEMVLKYSLSKLTILVAGIFVLLGVIHSLLQLTVHNLNYEQFGSYITLILFVIAAVYLLGTSEKQQIKKDLKIIFEQLNIE